MENKITNKKEFWYGGILGFIKLFFFTIVYLFGLIGGMLFLDSYNHDYVDYFIWFYLVCSVFTIIYFDNRDKFTRENLKALPRKIKLFIEELKLFGKALLKFLFYLVLVVLGIVVLVVIGGWIAGLSATTIIIFLLIMILLK